MFVEAHPRRAPNASVPDEWEASLVYDLKRHGRHPLTASEASRLENACDDWIDDHAPNMDADLMNELAEADERVEKYTREIPPYGKAIC